MFGISSVTGYVVALKGNILPVTPSSISVSVSGRNETVDLISGEQINILKLPSLAEISFDFLIPYYHYPFVNVELKPIKYYINLLDELMTSGKPFDYIVSRNTPDGKSIYATVQTVSLESYSYEESRENGLDVTASVVLKVYNPYETKKRYIEEESSDNNTTEFTVEADTPRADDRELSQYYTVKAGDTLWKICKDYFEDGSKYSEIASLNGISNPNYITVGQVIKMWG